MEGKIKKILLNKIFVYLGSRYATYAVQFLVSVLVAARLGPYYLGIYGFITLILNYMGQFNFGIPHSLNVLLVHNKESKAVCDQYIGNSLFFYTILSMIFLVAYAFIKVFGISLNGKYPIDEYLLIVILTGVITYYNYIITTVLRFRNKVNQLSIVQSVNVFLQLIAVLLLEKEQLVFALVLCLLLSCFISIGIAAGVKVLPSLSAIKPIKEVMKGLLHKGFYLFLYNSCFFFILLSIRSVISANYSIEDFGLFTFSFTMAHAALLLLESLMTIVFPKVIDLLSTNDYIQIKNVINKLRVAFISSCSVLILVDSFVCYSKLGLHSLFFIPAQVVSL